MAKLGEIFFGSNERVERINPLRPEQQRLYQNYQNALMGQGAGGASGEAADYYRSLMSGGQDAAFEAPLRREFQEDIMPGIAEQFAGMGAGAMSSSGFQQQASRAGTDLAERLGSIRAGLRMQGAQGLQGMAEFGQNPVDEMIFRPRQAGLLENAVTEFAGGAGNALGTAATGKLPFLQG